MSDFRRASTSTLGENDEKTPTFSEKTEVECSEIIMALTKVKCGKDPGEEEMNGRIPKEEE